MISLKGTARLTGEGEKEASVDLIVHEGEKIQRTVSLNSYQNVSSFSDTN